MLILGLTFFFSLGIFGVIRCATEEYAANMPTFFAWRSLYALPAREPLNDTLRKSCRTLKSCINYFMHVQT